MTVRDCPELGTDPARDPPSSGHLSPAEELRDAITEGRPVRRGGRGARRGRSWGFNRQLPADELFRLLASPDDGAKPRAAVLVGLRITGRVNFEGAELQAPLLAHGCYFDAPVNFIAAKAPEISLTACHLPGVAADQLETKGNLDLSETTLGVIGLMGAHIGGQLSFDGAHLTGGEYPIELADGTLRPTDRAAEPLAAMSLVADGLEVEEAMFCGQGFKADGRVKLVGARILGPLSFATGTLKRGLEADFLKVDQVMACTEGFRAGAPVELPGARIGGQLLFAGASLRQGLNAEGASVDHDLICSHDFVAGGPVNLQGSRIGNRLILEGATLHGGLTADGLQVGQDMMFGHETTADGPREFSADGKISLIGAHVGQQLIFDGATLNGGLSADGLRVDQGMVCARPFNVGGDVSLVGAHIGAALILEGATLYGNLEAALLQVDKHMLCGSLIGLGEVQLPGARIGGYLALSNATLHQGLNADDVEVDLGMECDGSFESNGEVTLIGARIRGHLAFAGAKLRRGLNAQSVQVGESMICNGGFAVEGEVRIPGAHIGGQLTFASGRLRRGLNGQRVRVDQDLLLTDGFCSNGLVRLTGAHIRGRLSVMEGTLADPKLALRLDNARIEGETDFLFAARPSGVDMTGARLGELLDSERRWPPRLRLRGCEYSSVQAVEDMNGRYARRSLGERRYSGFGRRRQRPQRPSDVERRLRWIRLAEQGRLEPLGGVGRVREYISHATSRLRTAVRVLGRRASRTPTAPSLGAGDAPSPYTQLMAFYRQEGRDGDARRVGYERERRRRRELGLLGKAWNAFLQWTVGYGYRPLRAVLLLGALVIVGTLVFSSFHSAGDTKAVRDRHPPFEATIYTLDRLIPVVSFGLRDAFAPSGAAQWWAFAYTLLGWALSVAVVAGLNAAVRRE